MDGIKERSNKDLILEIEKTISKIRKESSRRTAGDRMCMDIQLFCYRQMLKLIKGETGELRIKCFK